RAGAWEGGGRRGGSTPAPGSCCAVRVRRTQIRILGLTAPAASKRRWGNGPAARSLRRNLEARSRAALVERRSSLKLMVSIIGVGQARSKHHRGTTMYHYAGIDVSLESSTICVVDGAGKILRETKVASEPEALIAWFRSLGLALERIGLEAGPLSQWLYAALREAGFAVEL